jgi:MFS family permease
MGFTGTASAELIDDDIEAHDVSESSPLIPDTTDHVSASAPFPLKGRIVMLLCAFAFTTMLADNLQPAAMIQVLENVICDNYYRTHLPDPQLCKVTAVQKELATVRGYQQLVPVFAGLLCTVPYGLLAERIGRKHVLMLYLAGTFAAFSWVLAVCYFRFLPVRWVWVSGAFLFIGGGDSVASSVVHVMVTDVVEPAERAQIFLYLHAADVISGFVGPAISAVLMEKGYTWAVLLLAGGTLLGAFCLLLLCIPETLELREESSACTTSSQASTGAKTVRASLLTPLLGVLTSNPQAVLLLCIFAPQTAARELFTSIGLQYSNTRYSLSYASGNLLLSLFQGAQGLVVLVLLPFISRTIARAGDWTTWYRDRIYTIASIAVLALGLVTIGIAPVVAVEAAGLLLVALGSCTTGLLMSLLGGAVRPSQVSAVYSSALMLSIVMRSVTGPVFFALLIEGLRLGRSWYGLPFVVMAFLMFGFMLASTLIQRERTELVDEE